MLIIISEMWFPEMAVSVIFNFHSYLEKDSHFDLRIFFKWVAQPPTSFPFPEGGAASWFKKLRMMPRAFVGKMMRKPSHNERRSFFFKMKIPSEPRKKPLGWVVYSLGLYYLPNYV